MRNSLTRTNGIFQQEENRVITHFITKNQQVLSQIKNAITYGAPKVAQDYSGSDNSYSNNDRF